MSQCVFWRSGGCRNGAECHFAHTADAELPPCKYGRNCRFGSDCMFGHPEQNAPNASSHQKQQYGGNSQPKQSYGGGQYGGNSANPSQYYAGSSNMPIGSNATTQQAAYSRVPSGHPYSMGISAYGQFPATAAYGHPYGNMVRSYGQPNAQQPRGPVPTRHQQPANNRGQPQPPVQQNPNSYGQMPNRGAGGMLGGGVNRAPVVTTRKVDFPVQTGQPETHVVAPAEDPEAVLTAKIQGMAI